MDLVERYGELHFGLDFYLQAQGESCPAGSVCVRTPAEAGKQARLPLTPPPPPPPPQAWTTWRMRWRVVCRRVSNA